MVRDARVEPSTVDADIVDSSMTRAGPSMLMLHIVEGSISQTHFPDPSSRPIPQARTLRCLIQSRQFNMPVGMELTTSSARQDTAPLGRILLRSAGYFPTKSRRLLQHSSPLLLQGRWTILHCPGHYPALPRA